MDSSHSAHPAPIWRSVAVEAEPLVFVADGTSTATARLLFTPAGAIDVTSAASARELIEGVDYEVNRAARVVTLPQGSAIASLALRTPGPSDAGGMRRCTLTARYTHEGAAWEGWTPPDLGADLPRLHQHLKRGAPVRVGVLGDSIAAGYDASGFHGTPPHHPPFAGLVAGGLSRLTAGHVTLHNLAVAGSTSDDGRWLAAEMAACDPNLVIVAFGMNDASYTDATEFAGNIADIMRRVTDAAPDAEYVLVAPMRPTDACSWVDRNRFSPYRDALRAFSRHGVVVADVTAMWDVLLTRKHAWELSGNGSNHPNDFGHRMYAETILQTIGAFAASTPARGREDRERDT